MASPDKKIKLDQSQPETISGFIHSVSDVRISAKNSKYFNFMLQTSRDNYHKGVVFAPERWNDFKQAGSNKNPVRLKTVSKVLSKFILACILSFSAVF